MFEGGHHTVTHSKNEYAQITALHVRDGTCAGYRCRWRLLRPGDYYVNARDAVHIVWVDEPSVLQITGIGPWEARFVDDVGN